ncbi:MAG TPA: PAS domain S-box protein, partial [Gemmatimonadaceae bacterium]
MTKKPVVALFAAVLMVAAGSAVLLGSFRQMRDAAALRRQSLVVLSSANELLSSMADAETGQRGFLLTGDETFLDPYLAVRDSIAVRLGALRRLSADSAARRDLDALAPLLKAKLAGMAHVIELRRSGDVAGAQSVVLGGAGKRMMDSIRVVMRTVTATEAAALARNDEALNADLRRLLVLIIATSLLALACAVAFAYWTQQRVRQQLADALHLETEQSLDTQEAANVALQQINATLAESEERFEVTLASIGDAVMTTDASARVSGLNPIAEKLTGWTAAQAAGQQVSEVFRIINKETRQPATIPVAETLAHGTVQGLANHTVLIARDGSERDIADSCAPIRDRAGQVIGAVLVFRDVTAEYAVQQTLNDSSALIESVLATAADGIITFHASVGIVAKANPAAERIFGYPAAELIGKEFSLLVPELERDQLAHALEYYRPSEEARAKGLGREVMGRRKNGSSVPIELAVSEMMLAGERYFTAIVRDITARKEAEAALLRAGPLQSAIFNSANFSSIATDAKGVIQIFNVGAERMLGYAASDVMNKITPADISDPREVIARAQALSAELGTPIAPGFEALVFKASRGIEDIYELTYIRKDGSRFPAVVSVTALRDADDTIIGYLLIGTDNTARKLAEAALLKAGALQNAIFNSANFSSIATDAKGVIQIFNVGAERMLGYTAAEVMNKITPADISDPQEVIARAKALSVELGTPITPGFEALVFKASRGIEDIYELTYFRKDGSRFPAVVSVTALRDAQNAIIGYLL